MNPSPRWRITQKVKGVTSVWELFLGWTSLAVYRKVGFPFEWFGRCSALCMREEPLGSDAENAKKALVALVLLRLQETRDALVRMNETAEVVAEIRESITGTCALGCGKPATGPGQPCGDCRWRNGQ